MFFWSTPKAKVWNKQSIEAAKESLINKYGCWTAHNIALGYGVTTMNVERNYDTSKLEICVKTITENIKKPISELRILDLACLEGMYGIEFARQGATVVGIEVREINLAKARFVKEVLGITSIEFFKDDVRNISVEKYGTFDVILMNGILYHIDINDQLSFLTAASNMCDDLLYIDTHVSLSSDKEFTVDGKAFSGSEWEEFTPQTTLAEREKMLWASFENPKSFKLSLLSLQTALQHVGFSTTQVLPRIDKQPQDRIVVLSVQ